jgi:hypothetical protein
MGFTNIFNVPIRTPGASVDHTMGARAAQIVKVKDYNATGDGSADDTSAIQAAFNAAFGTSGAPRR